MGIILNPFTGKLDYTSSTTELDAAYVRLDGSNTPMTGTLKMGTNAVRLTDSNAVAWDETVDTTGHLVTTQVTVATPATGNPVGPGMWLWLTYA